MLKRLKLRKQETIVIEDDAIRYVSIVSANPLIIHNLHEVKIPEGVLENGVIKDTYTLEKMMDGFVRNLNIRNGKVQMLAPDDGVVVRKLAYEEGTKDKELRDYFFMEVGESIYLPYDDFLFDIFKFGEDEVLNEAIVITTKESDIKDYIKVFEKGKLDLITVEISPISLYRLALVENDFTEESNVMIVDVKEDKVIVSIFQGKYPLLMRSISITSEYNEEKNRDIMNDTIISEVSKLANFYQYNMNEEERNITDILIEGIDEYVLGLVEGIHERTGVRVDKVRKGVLKYGDEDMEVPTTFNRAIGLALRDVGDN